MKAISSIAGSQRSRLIAVLGISILGTAVLYSIPLLRPLARPLVYLSTLAHELGHGLAAAIAGGEFHALFLYSDGSGMATYTIFARRFGIAFVAAGGLVGPAVVAALLFISARRAALARAVLGLSGLGLVVAMVVVVRNPFAWLFTGVLALILLAVAWFGSAEGPRLTALFIAVQLAMSVFSRGDYLFAKTAQTAGGLLASDTAKMAEALWLPHWFWGLLCGSFSVLCLLLGLVLALSAARPSVDPLAGSA